MLLLIKESTNSPAIVYHCLYLISKLTLKLNPNQIPIVTADQPVYVIAKQLQWNYPENFELCFLILGPLHIEMAFLNVIGDWFEGSGWTDVFEKANFNTVGCTESLLSESKIKRSRYAHQVSLAALVTMPNIALESQNDFGTYHEWRKKTSERSVKNLFQVWQPIKPMNKTTNW